jgi:NADH dehydrogenase
MIGRPRPIISVSPRFGYLAAWAIGKMVGDVFLTRQEIEGLMRNLLWTASEPAGKTKLTDWTRRHADTLGVRYASELARRQKRDVAYEKL